MNITKPQLIDITKRSYLQEWYSDRELKKVFKSVGENVHIDRSCIFIHPKNISIGSNVRIDAFCHISVSELEIGNYVHIAPYVQMAGPSKIVLSDFCGLSSRVSLFTGSDDYGDGFMTNPLIPEKYRKIKSGNIVLKKHVIVGSGSVIMPGITVEEGASVGALTFVTKNIPEGFVVSGNPQKFVRKKNLDKLKELESNFLNERK